MLSSALSDSVLVGADLLLLLGFSGRALTPGLRGARCSPSTTLAEARREAPCPSGLAGRLHSGTTKLEQPRTALRPIPALAGDLAGSPVSSVSNCPPASTPPQVGSWHVNFRLMEHLTHGGAYHLGGTQGTIFLLNSMFHTLKPSRLSQKHVRI